MKKIRSRYQYLLDSIRYLDENEHRLLKNDQEYYRALKKERHLLDNSSCQMTKELKEYYLTNNEAQINHLAKRYKMMDGYKVLTSRWNKLTRKLRKA